MYDNILCISLRIAQAHPHNHLNVLHFLVILCVIAYPGYYTGTPGTDFIGIGLATEVPVAGSLCIHAHAADIAELRTDV